MKKISILKKIKDSLIGKIRRVLEIEEIKNNLNDLIESGHFLNTVSSLIHIGANTGQERDLYERFGLKVLWIEPIPSVFENLNSNIAIFKRQDALQALVTDVDDREYKFNVASNGGQSSSILEMNEHKDIWPEVDFIDSIYMKSKTLISLLEEQDIDPAGYEVLVIDTQGAELLVLKGAESILRNFRFIKTESADFESYSGCCTLDDLDKFLMSRNFRRFSCIRFARRNDGGAYYDVVYRNIG